MIEIGIYIGGDTQNLTFDFGLKVANSVAECPMKLYKGSINVAPINAPTITLTATTGTLAAGTYYYKVTATDEAGETTGSTEASITLASTGGVTISWTAVIGATGYKIYGRSTGSELYIATTTNTTYTDSGSITPSGAIPTTNTTGVPSPSASCWTEIVNQKTLDKLKAQNEIPITSVDYTNRQAVWNGKNLVLQSDTQPSVRDDFAGKVSGDTTVNGNKSARTSQTTLQAPSFFTWEDTQAQVDNIKTLDGNTQTGTATVAGQQPQHLFSFNLIRMLEDKYGSLPCSNDTASKVAWMKQNIQSIAGKWNGYGVGPLGNKANFNIFKNSNNSWGGSVSNTASSVSLLSTGGDNTSINTNVVIDSNGMVNFLAYTDSARTTDSTLLVLTGYGLSEGDLVYNSTRDRWSYLSSGDHQVPTANTLITTSTTGQVAGDTIYKYKRYNTTATAGTGSTTTTLVIPNHGLSVGDALQNDTRGGNSNVATVIDVNTVTLTSAMSGLTVGDHIWLFHFTGTQTAESTVISSNIYTDYISLDVQLKPTAGYDLLVPSNPRRDSVTNGNYDNIVMAEKVYNQVVSDFTGKISGSTTENPNIAKVSTNTPTSLLVPSSGNFMEIGQSGYDNIKTLNSSCNMSSRNTLGDIPQHLFQFNLIAIFEKQYGTIPATDKVSWLKANLNNIAVNWYGYGSCPSGNSCKFEFWGDTTWSSGWGTNIASTPTLITNNISSSYITSHSNFMSDGSIYFLAYAPASDGITASTIYTDYIKLTLTFNNGNNSIEYFTNNSVEIAVQTNSKASANLISLDTTPICNALYGASNSALLSSFKTTSSFDIYAQGYGASSNDIVNGVNYFAWNGTSWVNLGSNLTNAISKVTCTLNASNFVQSNNQIYLMVVSKYNSTTDVPSSISIDYISINLLLNRTPDVISPVSIVL